MEHFGISNVKRRLNIIYGDAAEIHFSNEENRAKENKAKVTIELPASEDLNRAKAEIKLPANKGLNKTNAEIDLSANKGLNKIEFFAEQAASIIWIALFAFGCTNMSIFCLHIVNAFDSICQQIHNIFITVK